MSCPLVRPSVLRGPILVCISPFDIPSTFSLQRTDISDWIELAVSIAQPIFAPAPTGVVYTVKVKMMKNKEDEVSAHTEKFGPLDEKLKKIDRKIDSLRIQRQHAETKFKDLNELKEAFKEKHGYKKQKLADQNDTLKNEWNGVSGMD